MRFLHHMVNAKKNNYLKSRYGHTKSLTKIYRNTQIHIYKCIKSTTEIRKLGCIIKILNQL